MKYFYFLLMTVLLISTFACNKSQQSVYADNESVITKARIKTNRGDLLISFYHKNAPMTVSRFIQLAQEGFYNGQRFHKVIPGVIVHTGDPTGSGSGGSGKVIKSEINELKHIAGTVGLSHPGNPNRGDSQFYITLSVQEQLDGRYTVFAQVVEGLNVLNQINEGDKILFIQVE